jgi:glycosyltransferase involved in cell wall biosynthesis
MPKVTVYIPAHNYGQYIEKAIQSVIAQSMEDWELILIDDGSTDNTGEILSKYSDHAKIRSIQQENKGLNVTSNIAIRLSNGKYIIRLDADDYFDENILLILSSTLDKKPDVGLVYPDYYHVDENGEIIEVVRRKKIGEEVELLDLPAHGACTMFRKSLLQEIGGYTEDFTCQDGYDIWIRIIQKHKPYNVNVPLFYYRQHPGSLTNNKKHILETRRQIKQQFVEKHSTQSQPTVLGIVPVIGSPVAKEMEPFMELNGNPLLWYTLTEIEKSKYIHKTVVSSDSDQVLEYAKQFEFVIPMKRPAEYTKTTTRMVDIAKHIISNLPRDLEKDFDAICLLYVNTPLRRARHIDKAIDTMTIFDVDSVVSIEEELAPCYNHSQFGLTPINSSIGNIRLERESIYKENGAICLTRIQVLDNGSLLGERVGHITMLPEESVKINDPFDFWLAEKILQEWAEGSPRG